MRTYNSRKTTTPSEATTLLLAVAFIGTLISAWFTHIFHCLFAGKYMLLIAGAFIAPVGIIHGIGLWFGVAW